MSEDGRHSTQYLPVFPILLLLIGGGIALLVRLLLGPFPLYYWLIALFGFPVLFLVLGLITVLFERPAAAARRVDLIDSDLEADYHEEQLEQLLDLEEGALPYEPTVKSAAAIGGFETEQCTAVLFGDIEQLGSVEYLFVLAVYPRKKEVPFMFVTSEKNEGEELFDSGSHFLCVFDQQGHSNLGCSDDWADPEKFMNEAVKIVYEAFAH